MKSKAMSADPSHILQRPYRRVLIPDSDSGTFAAMIAEFPGCVAQGASPKEAYARLEEAAMGWVEAALGLGQTVPEPLEENEYSGRFALRMPTGLHRSAAEQAEREGTSLNQFIVAAIAERVGASRHGSEPVRRLEHRAAGSVAKTVRKAKE